MANAKVLSEILPQIGTHPKIITEEAEDAGGIDELKFSSFPAEMIFPYIYGKMRAENDNCRAWRDICTMLERGLPSINGGRANMIRDIAVSLGSGGSSSRKIAHQPNFISRNTINRNWKQKAEAEGADIDE